MKKVEVATPDNSIRLNEGDIMERKQLLQK